MPDTSDFFNPPRPRFQLFRHPFVVIILALLVFGIGDVIYRLSRPASASLPTPANPDGNWIGELTMDGRYWHPATDGDTPGPHRHAVISFNLHTSDSFLDHHAGDGSLRIVGENITRPITAFGWQLDPDGTMQLEFNSTPLIFQNPFHCDVAGSNLTCKNGGPLKPRLTLHPGSAADANALLQQVAQRAAIETPLTPFPPTHQEVICSDTDEEVTETVLDSDPTANPSATSSKHNPKSKNQPTPRPCRPFGEN
jgi:hypothetical protein